MQSKYPFTLQTARRFRGPAAGFGSAALLAVLFIFPQACNKKQVVTVAVPVISAVSSNAVRVGDTLVIKGSGFSATPTDDGVAISDISLQVIAASVTQLSAVVQAGATSGHLTVGLPFGRPAVWPDSIVVLPTGTPRITAITPSSGFPGDTITLRGTGLGTPASKVGATVAGVSAMVLNSADTVLRLVVPDMAVTGPVIVTRQGLSSLPVQLTVRHVNPTAYGRVYWMVPAYASPAACGGCSYPPMNGTQVFRGKDSSGVSEPSSGTVTYSFDSAELFLPSIVPTNLTFTNANNPFVQDAAGNQYYVSSNRLQEPDGSYTDLFELVRLVPGGSGSFTRQALWTNAYNSYTTPMVTYYPDSANNPYNYYTYPDEPSSLLSLNGSQISIKIGLTNTYITGDISTPSPTFTTTSGLVDDSLSFSIQYGVNYVFYHAVSSPDQYSGYTVESLRYMPISGGSSQAVPAIDPTQMIYMTFADPSHGDNLLIVTVDNTWYQGHVPSYIHIYKFNASAGTLTKLYDRYNWVDAGFGAPGTSNLEFSGMTWSGSHIYYTNCRRNITSDPVNGVGGKFLYTGLYRIEDDGSSTKPATLYPHLEPLGQSGVTNTFNLFVESN